MDIMDNLKSVDKDDILRTLGLQMRPNAAETILPVLAGFGVGLLVGAGLAALTTPNTGRAMRKKLGKQVDNVVESVTGADA